MLEIMTEPSQRTTTASKAIKDAMDAIELPKTRSLSNLDMRTEDSASSTKLTASLDLVATKNQPKYIQLPALKLV